MNSNTVPFETIIISEVVKVYVNKSQQDALLQTQELSAPDEKRWVNWRFATNDEGKITKEPYKLNGRLASSTKPADWSTFAEVCAAQERFNGIGIIFTNTIPMLGIDLDHCIKDGVVSTEIATFIEKAHTFTEVSPSGEGLHLYLTLTEALTLEKKRSTKGSYVDGDRECYTTGRYFTFTGNPWTSSYPPRTVSPTEAIELLRMLGYPWGKQAQRPLEVARSGAMPHTVGTVSLTDEDLLKKMFASKNGVKIKSLYDGDVSAHGGDDSAADAALCSHLAFWTEKDPARIESLWLSSPLGAREKTQDREDYRKKTIDFAIANCSETYEVGSMSHQVEGDEPNWEEVFSPKALQELTSLSPAKMAKKLLQEMPIEDWPIGYEIYKTWNDMIRPLESPQDYEMAYLRLRVGIVPIQETRLDTLRA